MADNYDSTLVVLRKNKIPIANCSYDNLYTFVTALDFIINIINNYNDYLVCTKLPDEIMALRILQLQNERATRKQQQAVVGNKSIKFLESNYPSYSINGMAEDVESYYGFIAIDKDEQEDNWEAMNKCICIDLDENYVDFEGFDLCYTIDDYSNETGIEEENIVLESAPNFSFSKCPFTELEDVREFAEKHYDGWWLDDTKQEIIVPLGFLI